ncbi:MAG: PQQ-dependent sugar dehydrogenase, partial [Pseudomonadota bacterium]
MFRSIAIVFAMLLPTWAVAETLQTSAGPVRIDPVVRGLDTPWAIGLLPDGGVLVTEREGDLLHVADGQSQRVTGVPDVWVNGQGGLLDVTVARDFAQSRELFLTFSKPQGSGGGTALAIAKLSPDGARLTDVRTLFEMAPSGSNGRHFGSRVIEAPDGTLFVTLGDRGQPPEAQDLSS